MNDYFSKLPLSPAEMIFQGRCVESVIESDLEDFGVTLHGLSFDDYDCSVEIHGCPKDYVPSKEVLSYLSNCGFFQMWVNFKGMERHTEGSDKHYLLLNSTLVRNIEENPNDE